LCYILNIHFLYSYVCLRYRMHGLCTCILHNSETLEPLTWIRYVPLTFMRALSLSLSLSRTHVLYRVCWTSVNIWHSNQSLDLSFCISTDQRISPYCVKNSLWLVSWFVQTPPSKNRPFHKWLIFFSSKCCALSGWSLYASLSESPMIYMYAWHLTFDIDKALTMAGWSISGVARLFFSRAKFEDSLISAGLIIGNSAQ